MSQGHTDTVTSLILDGDILFSASDDGSVRTWSCKPRYALQVYTDHKAGIHLMLLAESTLVTCSTDGMIFFSNYVKEDVLAKFRKKDSKVFSLAFSYESRVLYMGSESENILKINFDDLIQQTKVGQKTKMKTQKLAIGKPFK